MKQLSILDEGQALATEGLNRAVTKANNDHPEWSDRCWQWFLKWLAKKSVGYEFLVEQFRNDVLAWGKIEKPNSATAFGFIAKRAKAQRLIVSAGKANTKSVKSHSANAEVWVKV